MKNSADFKSIAREALRGKWLISSVVAFLATVLGGTLASDLNITLTNSHEDINSPLLAFQLNEEKAVQVMIWVIVIGLFMAILICLFRMLVGGFISLGNAKYQLSLIDHEKPTINVLFSQFSRYKEAILMVFLVGIKTFLWGLLFIVPGIIASYRYAMAPYILVEHPQMSASQAIEASKHIMKGNKWRLFCLHFSFIGWLILLGTLPITFTAFSLALGFNGSLLYGISILLSIPLMIMNLVAPFVLSAYQECAQAAFYREISGTQSIYQEEKISSFDQEDLFYQQEHNEF